MSLDVQTLVLIVGFTIVNLALQLDHVYLLRGTFRTTVDHPLDIHKERETCSMSFTLLTNGKSYANEMLSYAMVHSLRNFSLAMQTREVMKFVA